METSNIRKRTPASALLDPKIVGAGDRLGLRQARSAHADQEPGHVRGRSRRRADHGHLPARPRRPAARISASRSRSSSGCGSPCCSPTSPRRSPKAAARRRPTRCARPAHRNAGEAADRPGLARATSSFPAPASRSATSCWSRPATPFPSDGEVIEGVASVNEAAITGESAPVIRESGGDRSAVTGGTQVLSDWIRVRITAAPGSTFLDRMIRLVEGAERQKTPNEIALNILLAGLTIIFVFATVDHPELRRLCRRLDLGGRAGGAVRHADPDDHRRAAVGDRHRRHGPARPLQRAGHVRPRGRGGGRRRHAAARQDRHDHARQPPGDRIPADPRRDRAGARRCRPACLARRRDAGRPLDRRAGQGEIRHSRPRCRREPCAVHSVHGADPHERRRDRRVAGSARARSIRS